MASIQVDFKEFGDTDAMLQKIDIQLRTKGLNAALRRSGQSVKRVARQLAPRSAQTGTTEKLSAKAKAKRGHPAKPLADTIAVVVRDYDGTSVLLVGPQYPAGSHGHLIEGGHVGLEWGRPGRAKAPKPFMRPAVDTTKAEQQLAFITELQKHMSGK